ncbi:PepSY domain-containing protein [Azospirillum sp. YIM B02556]|uniref:PepSY domain-containing protein n=1 Tax=Azospirillum endophyticum TaxID=2800326 RepID=A0ABS1F3V9_9PROT|nr:PepSY-associated TM helix domain-containing protein [Azospirillum endophyticum]MBK1838110.1 PepSY domain-containing protein [Azospirillum endophyticum]
MGSTGRGSAGRAPGIVSRIGPGVLRQRVRRFVLLLHLTLGLAVGALLALTALTGSLLVFYVEIDRMLTPELVVPAGQGAGPEAVQSGPVPLERVVQALRDAHPARGGGWRLELPQGAGHPIMARYMKPQETADKAFAPLMVAVNPYNGEVLSSRFWGRTAMTWIYDLHYLLLAGDGGRTVLTLGGIGSLLILASGVYLWWPAAGKWGRALRPRLRSGFVRQVFDVHVLAGVYGLVVLLPLIVTGVVMEQPDWVKPVVELLSPMTAPPDLAAARDGAVVGADAALAAALARFPQAEPRWVEVPGKAGGAYHIRLFQAGEPGWRFPKTSVWVNGGDGTILDLRDPARWTAGDAFFGWQHPLHNGECFGLCCRILVAAAGLLPVLLLATGALRWRQKKRTRPVRAAA